MYIILQVGGKMKSLGYIVMIGLISIFSGCSFIPGGNVTHNVYFNGQDLSDYAPQEVDKIVNDYYKKSNKDITLIDKNGKEFSYSISDIGISPSPYETAWAIRSYGYEPSMGDLLGARWNSLFNKINIGPKYGVDETISDAFFSNLAKELGLPNGKGELLVEGDKVLYKAPPEGDIINKEKTLQAIVAMLESGQMKPIHLVYARGVAQSKEGEILKKMTAILGKYTTYFNTGAVGRSHNIALATEKVNGVIVPPNGSFSYNNVVGERTAAAGFESAPVIVGGKLEPGIGGGICQLSSTIFNAALYSGMTIVDRTPHFEPVSYIPPGHDATVAYGYIDFVFKNPFKNPVYILSSLNGGELTVYILGHAEDQMKSVQIVEVGRETVPNKTITKEDKTIEGEKVEEEGHTGMYVINKRIMVKQDGTTMANTYDSYYDPLDKVVKKGKDPKEYKNKNKDKDENKETSKDKNSQLKKDDTSHDKSESH